VTVDKLLEYAPVYFETMHCSVAASAYSDAVFNDLKLMGNSFSEFIAAVVRMVSCATNKGGAVAAVPKTKTLDF